MTIRECKSILGQFKITILTAVVLCCANIGFIFDGVQNEGFQAFCTFMQYDRALILKGELWRLLTCHLVHWSPEHFYLDASVFLALGITFEQKIDRIYGSVLCMAGLVIGLTLLLFQTDLTTYRGISGLINTQIILGTGLFVFERNPGRALKGFYLSIFFAHLIKTAYEIIFQVSIFSTEVLGDLGRFTPLAHLAGVLVGVGYLIRIGFSPRKFRIFPLADF